MEWFCNSKKKLTYTTHTNPVCVPGFETLEKDGVPSHIIAHLKNVWMNDPEITPVDDSGERMYNHESTM